MTNKIIAIMLIMILLLSMTPSVAFANIIDDNLAVFKYEFDDERPSKEDFFDYIHLNATIRPWEDELGTNATRGEILEYLWSDLSRPVIYPADLSFNIDRYDDWAITFYLPVPLRSFTKPIDTSKIRETSDKIAITGVVAILTLGKSLLWKIIGIGAEIAYPPTIVHAPHAPEDWYSELPPQRHLEETEPEPEYGTISWTIGPNLGGEMKDGTYTGELKDGMPHGQGKWTNTAGEEYVGEWENGDFNGHGTWSGIDDHYIGEWKDNLLHGKGVYTHEGHVWDAIFIDGVFQEGIYTDPEGEVFYFD